MKNKHVEYRENPAGGEGRRYRRRRGGRIARRAALIVTLALAMVLARFLWPYLSSWLSATFFTIDYTQAAQQLTHEMEKTGDLIAVRHTDTGVMTGSMDALFLGTVGTVTAPYRYEVGLGVRLPEVKLTPEEDRLVAAVPDASILYDRFEVTDTPQTQDPLGLSGERQYQRLLDKQQAACRQGYEDDPALLEEAWETACEQLEGLFRQWTGENLRLEFVHMGQDAAE